MEYDDFAQKDYKAVGRCIYCGSIDDLSDEHILPLGLHGPTTLPDASCPKCRDITSEVEFRVLREHLPLARAFRGFRTRRPREQPKTQRVLLDGTRWAEVPLTEGGVPLLLPWFSPPGATRPESYKGGVELRGAALYALGGTPAELAAKLGAREIQYSLRPQPVAFARMIGKIAYAYAVAELGLDVFQEAGIVPAILGKSDDIGRWVGTHEGIPLRPAEIGNALHTIALQYVDGTTLVALVQLFADLQTPTYLAILGRVRGVPSAAA